MSRIPHIRSHPLESQLILRTLRLNCLVDPYASLWDELYSDVWKLDQWVPDVGAADGTRARLGDVDANWNWATPLRRADERRQALIEIDAIVAVMLGVTAEELLTVYRTQFPVLQRYEREALYDAAGRQVPGKLASEYRTRGAPKPASLTVDGITYREPFVGVDRERDLEVAHRYFTNVLREM